jgi:hypothetical protein
MHTYSHLKLTYQSDKLPALSGLALFLGQRHRREYYAGLFSGLIAEGLLWRPDQAQGLKRPQQYIAPSWSWLSLNGPIVLSVPESPADSWDPKQLDPWKSMLENIQIHLTPKGKDPYGSLLGGKMDLTGWLKSAQIFRYYIDDDHNSTEIGLEADGKYMAIFHLDVEDDAPAIGDRQDVECLYVLDYEFIDKMERDKASNILVLRQVKGGREYQRIGSTLINPDWFAAGGERKESITII